MSRCSSTVAPGLKPKNVEYASPLTREMLLMQFLLTVLIQLGPSEFFSETIHHLRDMRSEENFFELKLKDLVMLHTAPECSYIRLSSRARVLYWDKQLPHSTKGFCLVL